MAYQWISYAIAGYLLGSVPFGKLIAKRVADIDITRQGSGNIGATNVARQLGIWWGILTLLLDALKGLIPVAFFSSRFPVGSPGREIGLCLVGLSALLGHQFSIFHRFRGGKGVATALGVYLGISNSARLSCLVAFLLFFSVTCKWKFVSLGSLVSAAAMPLILLTLGESRIVVVMSLLATVIIFFAHKDNIKRLIKGKERKWGDRIDHPNRSRSLSNSSSE